MTKGEKILAEVETLFINFMEFYPAYDNAIEKAKCKEIYEKLLQSHSYLKTEFKESILDVVDEYFEKEEKIIVNAKVHNECIGIIIKYKEELKSAIIKSESE